MQIERIRSRKDLVEVEKYNKDYYDGKFRGTEATPINMDVAEMVVDLLEKDYIWVDEVVKGDWRRVDICPGAHKKYGTNYLYIDDNQKFIRVRESASEFYNH